MYTIIILMVSTNIGYVCHFTHWETSAQGPTQNLNHLWLPCLFENIKWRKSNIRAHTFFTGATNNTATLQESVFVCNRLLKIFPLLPLI